MLRFVTTLSPINRLIAALQSETLGLDAADDNLSMTLCQSSVGAFDIHATRTADLWQFYTKYGKIYVYGLFYHLIVDA